MPEFTPEQFAQRVVDVGLADPISVEHARAELGAGEISVHDLARALQRRGLLTTLQVDKLLKGDRFGYFYGDYKVLYMIGAGTFARVYRAAKRQTDEVVAVKVLRKRFRDEIAQLDQFLREGRMGLKLRHPHIVSIFEVNPDIRHPFMVMEFIEGQTLRELIRLRGTLPPKTALELMHDVASGLSYAASLGISHRDLKLSNVLVTSGGKAKLVDFGLAALADRNNPEQIADCPNARAIDYAALERGTNVRKDDPRSDIYFAGCMLYHLLCGKPPLTETRDRLARLNVSRFQQVVPVHQVIDGLPSAAVHVCNKAMEFDPAKRYQNAGQLQTELKRALERLDRGDRPVVGGEISITGYEDEGPLTSEGEGRVVMLIESRAELQNAIRQRLKSRGYRVLIFSDPERALARFTPLDDPPADAVVFGAAELGSQATEAFNRFGQQEHTADIPALLLVDRKQQHVIREAQTEEHRKMLALPLKVRELRTALLQLLADRPRRDLV